MSTDNPILEPGEQFYGKAEAEPEPIKPTENADVTIQDGQEPGQDVTNLDDPVKLDDESGKTEGSDATDEDENVQYLELDGKEYELEEVRKWQNGHMMQSDYTKKTTEHARFAEKERAEIASDRDNLLKSQSEVSEMRDQLAVLVSEDEETDWEELKDSDPEKYIELKEKADKRKAALEKVKADRATPADDPALITSEQGKLFAANPDWFGEDSKPTKVYSEDMSLMNEYAAKAGFSVEEFNQMTRAHYIQTVLKAAKYDQLQEKGRKIKQKRESVPLVTKPKAKASGQQSKSMADTFYPSEASG